MGNGLAGRNANVEFGFFFFFLKKFCGSLKKGNRPYIIGESKVQ